MAGIYGNSDYDRAMEQRLYRHLDEESAYDSFVEDVFEECIKIDGILSDSSDFDIFFNSKEISEIMSSSYYGNDDADRNKLLAKTIMDKFINLSKPE